MSHASFFYIEQCSVFGFIGEIYDVYQGIRIMDESKRPMGHPLLCTQPLIDEMCDYLGSGCPIGLACQLCGISMGTYSNWERKAKTGEEPFASMFLKIASCDGSYAKAHLQLIDKHANRDWRAAEWLLSKKFPSYFSKNPTRINVAQKEDSSLSAIENINNMTNEILQQLARGEITVDDAKAAMGAIEASRRVAETLQIKERVDQIEGKIKDAADR